MEKYLYIAKPLYSEKILPVPWHFVISRFYYTLHSVETPFKELPRYRGTCRLNKLLVGLGFVNK